jgi:hypothetical protein
VLTVSCGFAAVVPEPVSAMTAGFPEVEVLLIVSCPVAAPVAVGVNCTCKVAVWAGFNVTGRVPPTMVNPAPLMFAEFTVTGAVPLDVNVKVWVVEAFTATLPKLRVVALTVNCGLVAATLVPFRDTIVGFPVDEVLLIVSCPVAAPLAVGANCTCKVTDCVGFRVTGKEPLTIVKPAPAIVAEFTVTGAVPVDVSVSDLVAVVLTVMLPKLRVPALTFSCGFSAGAPVPVRITSAVLPVEELLLIVIWPPTAPVAVGLNCT